MLAGELHMNIVLIDDMPVNLALMEGMVANIPNIKTNTFVNPLEGLAWSSVNDPDLFILDYSMPQMNGIELIEKLRQQAHLADTPILMATANTERQVRYDALKAGSNDFINKPIDRYEFEPRVKNMLALRQAHLATRNRAALLQEEVTKATASIVERERETVLYLARATEFRDSETGAHIQRMSYYSLIIARELGFDTARCDMLMLAASMHDIGKLGIPDNILFKPDRLTEEEVNVMRQHTIIGHNILKDSTSPLLQLAANIALSHHERFDGTGYPYGLAGESIPIEGRIVAVADVMDALASRRPYKQPWSMAEINEYLKANSGTHFDSRCVEALLDNISEVISINEQFNDAAIHQTTFAEMHELST